MPHPPPAPSGQEDLPQTALWGRQAVAGRDNRIPGPWRGEAGQRHGADALPENSCPEAAWPRVWSQTAGLRASYLTFLLLRFLIC